MVSTVWCRHCVQWIIHSLRSWILYRGTHRIRRRIKLGEPRGCFLNSAYSVSEVMAGKVSYLNFMLNCGHFGLGLRYQYPIDINDSAFAGWWQGRQWRCYQACLNLARALASTEKSSTRLMPMRRIRTLTEPSFKFFWTAVIYFQSRNMTAELLAMH